MSEILGALFKYILGALGIAAVGGILYLALGNSKVSQAISDQTALQSLVQGAYTTNPNGFTSLSQDVVIKGRLAPASMIIGGHLTNAWNGTPTVSVDPGNPAQFVVSHPNLPAADCAKFASSQPYSVAISINGAAQTVPLDNGSAIGACSGATNTVSFTYAR